RHAERLRRATTRASLSDDLIGFQQRHVFQKQADHPFALTLWSGWIVPQAREVRHECHHLLALLRMEHPLVAVALALIVLLSRGEPRAACGSSPPPGNRPPGGCQGRRAGSAV